jgi:hypothetical protein
MFRLASPILFKALKVYGLGSILYDSLIGVLQVVEIDSVALTYSLAVEGMFFLMKSAHIEVPVWVEAIQDLT